jgi:hypothetical protein
MRTQTDIIPQSRLGVYRIISTDLVCTLLLEKSSEQGNRVFYTACAVVLQAKDVRTLLCKLKPADRLFEGRGRPSAIVVQEVVGAAPTVTEYYDFPEARVFSVTLDFTPSSTKLKVYKPKEYGNGS